MALPTGSCHLLCRKSDQWGSGRERRGRCPGATKAGQSSRGGSGMGRRWHGHAGGERLTSIRRFQWLFVRRMCGTGWFSFFVICTHGYAKPLAEMIFQQTLVQWWLWSPVCRCDSESGWGAPVGFQGKTCQAAAVLRAHELERAEEEVEDTKLIALASVACEDANLMHNGI